MVVFDETSGPEEAADTHGDFVKDILDEILENIDYNKKKRENIQIPDFSSGETLVEDDGDFWFIRELVVNMIDSL